MTLITLVHRDACCRSALLVRPLAARTALIDRREDREMIPPGKRCSCYSLARVLYAGEERLRITATRIRSLNINFFVLKSARRAKQMDARRFANQIRAVPVSRREAVVTDSNDLWLRMHIVSFTEKFTEIRRGINFSGRAMPSQTSFDELGKSASRREKVIW